MINKNLLSKIQGLPASKKQEFVELLEEYEQSQIREQCADSFMAFVRESWAAFIHGKHHEIMAEAFELSLIHI